MYCIYCDFVRLFCTRDIYWWGWFLIRIKRQSPNQHCGQRVSYAVQSPLSGLSFVIMGYIKAVDPAKDTSCLINIQSVDSHLGMHKMSVSLVSKPASKRTQYIEYVGLVPGSLQWKCEMIRLLHA